MKFSIFQRFFIELRIFFATDILGLSFQDKIEKEEYYKKNILERFLIRREYTIKKTNEIENYLSYYH
jgi:hypothetical protein